MTTEQLDEIEKLAEALREARNYAENRNDEANKLQRFLNMAARERDEARAEVERLTHNFVQTERHLQIIEKSLADIRAEVERLREAARQIAAAIERAADVKAASVVLGEPIGGSAVVYDLRRFAVELRQAVEVKPCETTNC